MSQQNSDLEWEFPEGYVASLWKFAKYFNIPIQLWSYFAGDAFLEFGFHSLFDTYVHKM